MTFLQIAVYAASFYADEETVRNWTELAERKIAEDDVVKGLLDGEVCVRIGWYLCCSRGSACTSIANADFRL